MEKKCLNCNICFKTYTSKQKFCGKKCASENHRLDRIEKECEYSGCTNIIKYVEKEGRKPPRTCSVECQIEWQKEYQKGKNNGNYGRENKWGKHPKEIREIISNKVKKSWENPERLEKTIKGFDKYRKDDGSFIWQTVEYRENISQKNIERLIKNPTYGAYKLSKKGYYTSLKTKDEEYYHSNWEREHMIKLDEDNNVKFWTKKHEYVVKYIHNGVTKRYLPDFYIETYDGIKYIEEIKGYVMDEEKFKIIVKTSLQMFNEIGFDYIVNFMYGEKKYKNLIQWIENYEKNNKN